jgi:segregation and condensation protein B
MSNEQEHERTSESASDPEAVAVTNDAVLNEEAINGEANKSSAIVEVTRAHSSDDDAADDDAADDDAADDAVGEGDAAALNIEGAELALEGSVSEQGEQLDLPDGPADEELFRAIEAILMVADEPVTPQLLGELLEVGPARAESLCNKLNERFTEENRGFVVARVAGGYRFQSHPDLAAYVERFVLDGQAARLSAAAMETLAIVAYKQPISRAQVAAIRGVNVDGVMRTLVQRNYVAEIAVDPGPGQATLFGTTSLFLQNLGLDSIAQLPPLGDLVPGAEVMEALEASLRVDSETGRMTRGTGAGLDGNPTEVPIGLAQDPGETLLNEALSNGADEAAEGEELFDLETLDSAIVDRAVGSSNQGATNVGSGVEEATVVQQPGSDVNGDAPVVGDTPFAVDSDASNHSIDGISDNETE